MRPERSRNPVINTLRPYFPGVRRWRQLRAWRKRGYGLPAPNMVKIEVLLRRGLPDAIWIETGTFLGDTTDVLGRRSAHVYTIEPSVELAARARRRFLGRPNITVLEGTSEEMLEPTLGSINGDVNFWLDGHFSSGAAFEGAFHGVSDTPIIDELQTIERHLSRLDRIVICIDDIRCFRSGDEGMSTYPERSFLVEWADRHGFSWEIEHDILIATRLARSA